MLSVGRAAGICRYCVDPPATAWVLVTSAPLRAPACVVRSTSWFVPVLGSGGVSGSIIWAISENQHRSSGCSVSQRLQRIADRAPTPIVHVTVRNLGENAGIPLPTSAVPQAGRGKWMRTICSPSCSRRCSDYSMAQRQAARPDYAGGASDATDARQYVADGECPSCPSRSTATAQHPT